LDKVRKGVVGIFIFFLSLKEATSLSSLPILDNKKRRERLYETYRDKSYEEINIFLSSLSSLLLLCNKQLLY